MTLGKRAHHVIMVQMSIFCRQVCFRFFNFRDLKLVFYYYIILLLYILCHIFFVNIQLEPGLYYRFFTSGIFVIFEETTKQHQSYVQISADRWCGRLTDRPAPPNYN